MKWAKKRVRRIRIRLRSKRRIRRKRNRKKTRINSPPKKQREFGSGYRTDELSKSSSFHACKILCDLPPGGRDTGLGRRFAARNHTTID
jgi:hypothetical protein